jgi:hypothetical protein
MKKAVAVSTALVCLVWLGQPARSAAPEAATPAPKPVIRDKDTPRTFPEISSRAEWQARAKEIREQVLVSCGLWPMPERPPLEPHVFGKIERDGYSVEKVYLQTLPGFYLAGNLYRPLGRGRGPFPAILNPHGHWGKGRLADETSGSIAARCISFARQGMIAFSYDMVGYNDTHFAGAQGRHEFAVNPTNQLWSVSLMGLQTWNSIRALDFLESLPDADGRRVACTGESGGGTQTFILGAIEDRLAAQAPVVMVSHTMQGGCLCENAPGLRVEYSNMEIAAAAAPRPQMLVAATGDWTKDTMTVEGPALGHIYRLMNAVDKLKYVRFDFDHNYNQTSREAVYGWFGKWLLGERDPARLKEQPYQKEPDQDLRVWPDGSLPADAATEAQVTQYLVGRTEARLQALAPRNRRGLAQFKEIMLPAWKHTLQLEWPVSTPEGLELVTHEPYPSEYILHAAPPVQAGVPQHYFGPTAPGQRAERVVILACGKEAGMESELFADADKFAHRPSMRRGAVTAVWRFSTGEPPNPFNNFFTVYNRTEVQERVGDLARACAFARGQFHAKQVILWGSGRAGLWALLAAPAADAVVADCDGLDTASDQALLAPDLFCPGLRAIDGFQGAALLAAPHPLLLHNTSGRFATETLRSAYRGLGAPRKLRVEREQLSGGEIAQWLDKL